MSIVTKGGDKGKTSLYRGSRVSKDHIRVETVGTLDELSSYLGLITCLIKEKKIKKTIESIEEDLFIINAEIATQTKSLKKLRKRIDIKDISGLEELIIELEAKIRPKLKGFSLSGKNQTSSNLDIARTITRRAERRVVTLQRKKMLKNKDILIYLNRLSDFLYLLSRSYDKKV
jgi:cob(I)alamin adenosyltransferase